MSLGYLRTITALAVAAAAVLVPWRDAPAVDELDYTETIQPPGPGSAAGEIAQGTIDGKGWKIVWQKAVGFYKDAGPCVFGEGPAFESLRPGGCGLAGRFPDAVNEPLSIIGEASAAVGSDASAALAAAYWGAPRSDVAYAKVTFGNHLVVTVRPVTVYGVRVIAFAAPLRAVIVALTAYSRHGEIATTIPLSLPGTAAYFGAWYRPGQGIPGAASAPALLGPIDGHSVSAVLYVGPWGVCLQQTGPNGSYRGCVSGISHPQATGQLTVVGDSPGVFVGTAAPEVARIVVRFPHGKILQVRPVDLGAMRIWTYLVPAGWEGLPFTAYGARGNVVT